MSTLPLFVINMPSATDRRASITRQLESQGLSAEWIAATRGKDMTASEVAKVYDERANCKYFRRALSPGEIGCYVSHREAWQALLNSTAELAVILEDDIRLGDQFPLAIKALESANDFDIIKLSDDRNCPIAQAKVASAGFEWVSYKRVPNCANGYAISRKGAEKLLSRERFFRPVDVDFQFHRELKLSVAGLIPYSIEATPDFPSSIDGQGKHGSRKTFTWPWRNWRYRLSLFVQRQFYTSAQIQDVPNE